MFGPLVKRREAKDSAERNKTTATTPVAAAAAAAAATATTTKTTPAEEASSKDFPQRRRIILKVKGSSCWLSTALGTACILARPSFFMGNAATTAAARSMPVLTSGPPPRPGPSPSLPPRRARTPATTGKASIPEGEGTGDAGAAISSERNELENGTSRGAWTSSRGSRTGIAKSARVWNQERPRLGSTHGRGAPPPRLDAVWELQEKDHFGLPPAPAPPPLPPPGPLAPVHAGERGSFFSLPSGGREAVSRASSPFDEHDVGITGTEIVAVGEADASAAAAAASAGQVPAAASQSPTRPSPFLDVVSAGGGGISLSSSKSGRPWQEAAGSGFEGGREPEGEAGEVEAAAVRAEVAAKQAGDGDRAFPKRREEVKVGAGGIRETRRPHSHDADFNGGIESSSAFTLEAAAEEELTSWGGSHGRRFENRGDHRRRGGSASSQNTVLLVDTEAGVDRGWTREGDASTDTQHTLVAAGDYLPLMTAALEAGDDALQSPAHKARAPRRPIDRGRMFLRGRREITSPATNGRENWEMGSSGRSGMYYEGDGVSEKRRYRVTGTAAGGEGEQEEAIATSAAAGTEGNRMASEWEGTVNNAFEGSGAPGDMRAQGLGRGYSRRGRSGREMREGGVGGRRKLLSEENVGESTCELDVLSGISEDEPLIFEPAQGDVLERGSVSNISWNSALFEDGASGSLTGDDDTDDLDTTGTQSVVVDKVNITLLNGNDTVMTIYDINSTDDSTYRWTVPSDVAQGQSYRVAVWEAKKNICGISYFFGISSPLSLNVTSFESFPNVDNASSNSDGGTGDAGEILSCGAVEVTWNFTGLVKFVDVQICRNSSSYGDMAGLEDESSSSTQEDQTSVCLKPISKTLANASRLNTTLDGSEPMDTCGVYGESFFAKVSNSDSWGADMVSESERAPVLGGVFIQPNDTDVDDDAWNIYDSQEIVWRGLTGARDEASVDIFMVRRGNSSERFVVVEGDRRDPTDGVFVWEDPASVFPEDDLDPSNIVTEMYYLELHIAGGGGLLCRSQDFGLRADSGSSGWEFQFLLVLLTPAGLLLLCCLLIFFVACPYYDKIVRQRRRAMSSSLIDIDDTYIIDGEGQPAILALGAQVIPLAHAHHWPAEVEGSTASMRRASSGSGSNGPWGRAVRAMGQSVTGSGRTGGYSTGGSGGGVFGIGGVGSGTGGGSNGSASGGTNTTRNGGAGEMRGVGRGEGRDGGGGLDDSSSRFASAAMRDYAAGSSVSSYRGMRSGATWAFGGGVPGGSIGRRSGGGGRRDGGGVYPTAAAALGLGTTLNQDLEEKSEAAVSSVGSVSPSAASGAGGGTAFSGTRQSQSMEGQTTSSTVDRASRTGVAGSSTSCSSGRSAGASSGMTGGVDNVTASGAGAGDFAASSAAVAPQRGSSFLGLDGDGRGGDVEGEGSNNASSSWNSVLSSRVDMGGVLGRGDSGGGLGGGGAGGVVGRDGGDAGVQGGGAGWLGRLGGGGGSERERIMPVVVTRVEATQVEIVEVSRAVVIDVNGVEIPTTTTIGMEVMEEFSEHDSYDAGAQPSPGRAPVV